MDTLLGLLIGILLIIGLFVVYRLSHSLITKAIESRSESGQDEA